MPTSWLRSFALTHVNGAGCHPGAAVSRLDEFFRTGYAPTNVPGIHAPWLYNALGQLWKTQQTVRARMDRVYGTVHGPERPTPGNDDLGTMSAWYVWGALGMYPQTPTRGEMLLSSPIFPKVWINRHGGPTIKVGTHLRKSRPTGTPPGPPQDVGT